MISNTEIELYGRVCELEGISFIECNKDILDLLKITYSKVSDVREFSKNNLIKIENVFSTSMDNFKNFTHLLKTLESKCDKNLNRFENELDKYSDLKYNFRKYQIQTTDRLDRHANIIVINFWVTFILLCIIFFV